MYRTCLFCQRALGHNREIEAFPVGRRLAFDATKGRLWIVCSKCGRWNLTPLEERWEAIEACERRFRDLPVRAQTGQIGLARLPDGADLIRIGRPLLPEFSAWRYGERFVRRRRRHQRRQRAASWAGTVGFMALTGATSGLASAALSGLALGIGQLGLGRYLRERVVLRVPTGPRFWLDVRERDIGMATFASTSEDGPFVIRVTHAYGERELSGVAAQQALVLLLARVNAGGGATEDVEGAVGLLESAGGVARFVARVSVNRGREPVMTESQYAERVNRVLWGERIPPDEPVHPRARPDSLLRLSPRQLLALEIAVNEGREQRAIEGELAPLEQAWREAEEIAAIADDLLLPPYVIDALARLRKTWQTSRPAG